MNHLKYGKNRKKMILVELRIRRVDLLMRRVLMKIRGVDIRMRRVDLIIMNKED